MSVDTSSHHDATNGLPRIAGFRLLREIGQGGMSTVYLAEQESLGRKVALKVMLPEALTDEVSRRRFENEARTIARLDHPNIVGIYEVGRTADDLPFYAMPYLGPRTPRPADLATGRPHQGPVARHRHAAFAARGARLRAHARRRASRRQGGERVVRRRRAAAARRLRHRIAQGHQPARHDDRPGGRQHRLHAAGTGARRRRRQSRRSVQHRCARVGNAHRRPAVRTRPMRCRWR